jgi:erythromycin esterase-like protein
MDAHAIEDLVDLLGDARLVLLGEASHGTHEFYDLRAEISRRLVTERGFRAVAVVERLLHDAGVEHGVLEARTVALARELSQRMIGVIYRPETERWSHYVEADVGAQLDLLVHLDRTTALEPLDRWPGGEEEPADTFPSGL